MSDPHAATDLFEWISSFTIDDKHDIRVESNKNECIYCIYIKTLDTVVSFFCNGEQLWL